MIVRLEGHKRFGQHHVLKGVDMAIPEGKITVIIGDQAPKCSS